MVENNPYASSNADDDIFNDKSSNEEQETNNASSDGMTLGGGNPTGVLPDYLEEALVRFSEEAGVGEIASFLGGGHRSKNPVHSAISYMGRLYQWVSSMMVEPMMCHGEHYVQDVRETGDIGSFTQQMNSLMIGRIRCGISDLYIQTQLKTLNNYATKNNASLDSELASGSVVFVNIIRLHVDILQDYIVWLDGLYKDFLEEGLAICATNTDVNDRIDAVNDMFKNGSIRGDFDPEFIATEIRLLSKLNFPVSEEALA